MLLSDLILHYGQLNLLKLSDDMIFHVCVINITKNRSMNSSSHTNSQFYATNQQIATPSGRTKKTRNPERDRDFSIPHINKRMNTIEKYVQEFGYKP